MKRPTYILTWLLCISFACVTTLAADAQQSPRPNWQNIAAGQPVEFNTPPNYPDVCDSADAQQITDGLLAAATPLWYDKAAVGWVMVDPSVFTIDLGSDQPIRGVALHTAGGSSGVEWPTSVRVFASVTGDKFSYIGDLIQQNKNKPPAEGYAAMWLVADQFETHGRYLKLVCSPANLGSGAYIMADEVEVYRGKDAWLDRPLVSANAPSQWSAPLQDLKWVGNLQAVPQVDRPRHLRIIDDEPTPSGLDQPLQQAINTDEGVAFTLLGEAGRQRTMFWTAKLDEPVSAENCRYVSLTYRAQGIRRMYDVYPIVVLEGVNDGNADNNIMLLQANSAYNDGERHTIIKPLPEGFTLHQIKAAIVSEYSSPRLVIEKLELLNELPAIADEHIVADAPDLGDAYVSVSFTGQLNNSLTQWYDNQLATYGAVVDGARTLEAGPVVVAGAPFMIAEGKKNLAAMPHSQPTTQRVEFLGEMVDKCFLNPESRHDMLSVAVDAQASEAYLLLALNASPIQKRGGHANIPRRMTDIEGFSVELVYNEGESEIAFPYSLADEGCYISSRLLGAYAVAVDPQRQLKEVVLHNRHFGPRYALVALTLNTSDDLLVRELAEVVVPQRTRVNPEPKERALSMQRSGDHLVISNRWYEWSLNLAEGFVIDRFVNHWNEEAEIELSPSSGMRLRVGDTVYTGRSFKCSVVSLTENKAELLLISKRRELPMQVRVTITADDSPELRFTAQTINRGDEVIAAELSLPSLADVKINSATDTRIFFPQYTVVDTGDNIALRAPYGMEFTQQYMDIYSKRAGVGVMLRTDNQEQRMADYTLAKNERGVTGGVCFPAQYNELAAGESRDYVPVSLVAHGGDWRDAMAMHRQWLRSWYKPYKSQDKDYLLNAWDLMCYRTSVDVSWADTRTPAFISPDRKKFLTEETFEFEKNEHLGHVPDLVHFYNWTHNDKTHQNEYGVHGTPLAYEQVGGVDFFREGIRDIQETHGVPVSLYTLFDRFRASALPDKRLQEIVVETSFHQVLDDDGTAGIRANGNVDGIFYPKHGNPELLEFSINDIVNMQRDTNCKLVYFDVFPHLAHLRGHNGISPRQSDMNFLKPLRERLPADVAMWSEYPATDVGSQYLDAALQYYFLDLREVFARRYDESPKSTSLIKPMPMNAGRYLIPRYKSICLPGYIEVGEDPSQVDAIFVNGEAIQEDTWRLHHSRLREKINRSYVVKHTYNDCFTTDNPSPQVDTQVEGIVANHFPGDNRSAWTLYNGRPKTFSGVVLAIPHKQGAIYRDAWNDVELNPVIEDGFARIDITLGPHQPGCVVQELAVDMD